MATYIESALGDFIKSILTRGIRTLKSPRFLPYSIFLLFIVFTGTAAAFIEKFTEDTVGSNNKDLLLFAELSAAVSFIFVGILLGRLRTSLQMIIIISLTILFTLFLQYDTFGDKTEFANKSASIFYILWIIIVTFTTFSLFRDLFANETFGTVLFLGKPQDDGKVMFAYIGWLLAIINFSLGYFIYTRSGDSDALFYTAIIIMVNAAISIIPLFGFQKKNDVFYTILTSFYMFSTIKVFLLTFRAVAGTGGDASFWDTLFSLFVALYAIQNAAVKGVKIGEKVEDENENEPDSLEEELLQKEQGIGFFSTFAKFVSDRGMVLIILGIVLGYHAMQVQTIMGRSNFFQEFALTSDADMVVLGYETSLFVTLVIYLISVLFFLIIPPFRSYANPVINRIPWAPPYDELKLVVSKIRSGEISWRGDAMKMMLAMSKDALKAKFRRKSKPKEERFKSTWGKWLGKDKKDK